MITWKPAMSAVSYEVQLSRQLYPWAAAHSVSSVVPSAVLPLTRHDVGTWYYRVRGINPNLVGPAQKLSWSKPAKVRISGDASRSSSSLGGVSRSPDLAFAFALADAADAETLPRFRSSTLRVETKPDLAGVGRGSGGGGSGARARLVVRPGGRGLRRGVRRRLRLGRAVDRRSDRRDEVGYVRGVPVWATLLALERDGAVVCAVVSAPALRTALVGGAGRGHVRGRCARAGVGGRAAGGRDGVDDQRTWDAGRLAVDSRRACVGGARPRGFLAALPRRGRVGRWGCDPVVNLWDFAAVRLLVEEAGGRCSTFGGGAPAHDASFISSNGLVHDELLAALSDA